MATRNVTRVSGSRTAGRAVGRAKRGFPTHLIVLYVACTFLVGFAIGAWLFSANSTSTPQTYNGTIVKVDAQGLEACIAFPSSPAPCTSDPVYTTGRASLQPGEHVVFQWVPYEQPNGISGKMFVILGQS